MVDRARGGNYRVCMRAYADGWPAGPGGRFKERWRYDAGQELLSFGRRQLLIGRKCELSGETRQTTSYRWRIRGRAMHLAEQHESFEATKTHVIAAGVSGTNRDLYDTVGERESLSDYLIVDCFERAKQPERLALTERIFGPYDTLCSEQHNDRQIAQLDPGITVHEALSIAETL